MRLAVVAAVLLAACSFHGDVDADGGPAGDSPGDGMPPDALPIDAPVDAVPIDAMPHISLVQKCSQVSLAGGAAIACTMSAPQTVGNTNLVVVDWGDIETLSSVTDSAGNTYVATGVAGASNITSVLYYAPITVGGAGNQITATLSATATIPKIRVLEYAGLAPDPFLSGAANSGLGTALTVGPIVTTVSHALVFAALRPQHTAEAVAPLVARDNSDGDVIEDEEVYATGTYAATATQVITGTWVMLVAAFRGL